MRVTSFSHRPYRFQLPATECVGMLGCAWILRSENDSRIGSAAEGYG